MIGCSIGFAQACSRPLKAALADALADCGLLDLGECFIAGTFAPAKRGGPAVGKTKKGKGSQMMALLAADGLPVASTVDSANPHEVKRRKQTLEARFLEALPQRLMGDNAYDSDALDAELARQGIEVIAPHRSNRRHKTQDGRPLRRKKRRYKGERFFAGLQAFRRLLGRWEARGRKTSWDLSISPVCSSCYDARYELGFIG